jgi:hypothetical protein
MRGILPLLLIGFGIYILRGYIFKTEDRTSSDGRTLQYEIFTDIRQRS